jgi:hypothetical protein
MKPLRIRIMHMIKELHLRGFSSVYLYSGLSPSGMHWRYEIGQMVNEQWPSKPSWVNSSVQSEGSTIWAEDNSSVALLAYGFQQHFKDRLIQNYQPTAYSHWYANVLASLDERELLMFFADYGGKHEHLLLNAPGYKNL